MVKLMHPFFGDLVSKAVVAFCFLFVIGLIIDAWWQKRQARLMRELSKGQFPHSANRVGPLHVFFKRFGAKFIVPLVVASMMIGALFLMKKRINAQASNSADVNDIAAYATNFQGDATRLVPATDTQQPGSDNTNLAGKQNAINPGQVALNHETSSSPDSMTIPVTNMEPKAIGSSVEKSPGHKP